MPRFLLSPMRSIFVDTLALVALGSLLTLPAHGSSTTSIVRQGLFEAITDSVTHDYVIDIFRFSADGSAAVYIVTRNVSDDPNPTCTTRQQVRRVEVATKNEVVIDEGYNFDTQAGNQCASNLWGGWIDISDDGSKVAWIRLNTTTVPKADDPQPDAEIVVCQFDSLSQTCTSTQVVLQEVARRSSGAPAPNRRIEPVGGLNGGRSPGPFAMSGDGNWIVFLNAFGLYGIQGGSDPAPSGETLYRVPAAGGVPSMVLEQRDLQTIGCPASCSGSFTGAGRSLDLDGDGSTLVIPATRAGIIGWGRLLTMDTAAGLAGVSITYENQTCCNSADPTISGDGLAVSFTATPSGQTGGTLVQTLDVDRSNVGLPVVIDPLSTSYACISKDGSAVGLFDSSNGRNAIRWAPSDGSALVPVSKPALEVWDGRCQIKDDGSEMLLHASIKTEGLDTSILPRNLVHLRWGSDPTFPTMAGVAGLPCVDLVSEPYLSAEVEHRYLYEPSNFAPGLFGDFYSYPWSTQTGREAGVAIIGENSAGGIPDDGDENNEKDAVAGDGIYTDGHIAVFDDFLENHLNWRVGFTLTNGKGIHADIVAPIWAPFEQSSNRSVYAGSGFAPTDWGSTGVTLQFHSNATFADLIVQSFDEPAPGYPEPSIGFWRFADGTFGRFVRPGLTTFSATAVFAYSDGAVAGAGLVEAELALVVSNDCGGSWSKVPAIVDPVSNTVTAGPFSDFPVLFAIGRFSEIFADGFESGNLSTWSVSSP